MSPAALSALIDKMPEFRVELAASWFSHFSLLVATAIRLNAERLRECSKCGTPVNGKSFWVMDGSGEIVCEQCYEFMKSEVRQETEIN